ncbi:MAG: BlaI/MecI/CopY family transcriptional regulator [Lachnospiraceae bacterium]|nr:BlaI/MecI/CopY family transcriptional regulator [Lachnospiraceae bacterium]MDE7334623.1 BlaI/MecI/CopY family transcriptional regulator [Lachnospiraceae bacterium]
MLQQISESELVLMNIIWKNGGIALYSFIMDELEKDRNEWKKNTVLTLLSRLIDKKFLKTNKIGRRNEYAAVVTQQEYQAMQTHRFLDRIYGGDVKNLVSTLLQEDIISSGELKEIEDFWNAQKQRRNGADYD